VCKCYGDDLFPRAIVVLFLARIVVCMVLHVLSVLCCPQACICINFGSESRVERSYAREVVNA